MDNRLPIKTNTPKHFDLSHYNQEIIINTDNKLKDTLSWLRMKQLASLLSSPSAHPMAQMPRQVKRILQHKAAHLLPASSPTLPEQHNL
jgi:hypothetical protein